MLSRLVPLSLAALLATAYSPGMAQTGDQQNEIAKNRQQLEEDNPAELWDARGENLWSAARGPKQAALTACDLGLGPGVVKGAYVHLPRYFADTGKVQDLESRLLTCMTVL